MISIVFNSWMHNYEDCEQQQVVREGGDKDCDCPVTTYWLNAAVAAVVVMMTVEGGVVMRIVRGSLLPATVAGCPYCCLLPRYYCLLLPVYCCLLPLLLLLPAC
jgi:hypothetical protein